MLNLMKTVLAEIEANDKIIIFRHKRPDGDAIGSTKGLLTILRETYPEKEIKLINFDFSDYLAFLGGEDADVGDEFYSNALGIVLDTATKDRISNPKFALCKKLIKIDHHIPVEDYGDINLVIEDKSSCCELITEFYYVNRDKLKITKEAATYLYVGMVTDSGRFRFRSVSGDTMRLAGMLLDMGIDVDTIYANLYMKDFADFKFESYVYEKMSITESGVAYIHVDEEIEKEFNLTSESASAAVGYMDSIKGSLIWMAFIDNGDGSTRVRLRSRFVTISELAEKYHGGGHACAAGATVYSLEEMNNLIADADARLAEYKANNEGWL